MIDRVKLPDVALIDQVEELVVLGVPPVAAALAQGVTEQQFAEWITLANAGGRGSRSCVAFRDRIVTAEARCESVLIGRIRGASKDSWQAAAWLAERRFPSRYVRRSVSAEPAMSDSAMPASDPFAEVDDAAPVAQVVPLRREA